jgi:hypothetical protein
MIPPQSDRPTRLSPLAPLDATAVILQAFDRYSVVALGECFHGEQKYYDFVISLIRHPSFQAKIKDIVIEIGNALYQGLVDSYISGQEVSLSDLRQIWRNHTCTCQIMDSMVSEPFYAAVREVNQPLPAAQRLRVVLGDPPIDWTKIQTKSDWEHFMAQRDHHFAQVVEDEVLAKGRKALLIAGTAHLMRTDNQMVISLVEKRHPDATFVIAAYGGPDQTLEMNEFFSSWPVPSIGLVKDTCVGEADGGLHGQGIITFLPDGTIIKESPYKGMKIKDMLDAYLYLGPPDSLQYPISPGISQDEEYISERGHRRKVVADDRVVRSALNKPFIKRELAMKDHNGSRKVRSKKNYKAKGKG